MWMQRNSTEIGWKLDGIRIEISLIVFRIEEKKVKESNHIDSIQWPRQHQKFIWIEIWSCGEEIYV